MTTTAEALAIALQHHQAGRLIEAEPIYRQILAAEPNQAEALHLLGVLAHQVGRNDVASDYIRRAIAVQRNEGVYHCNLGNVFEAQDKFDEAIACHQRALALNPNLAEAHSNLGNLFVKQGKLEDAVFHCRRAVELEPGLAAAYNNLGNVLLEQGNLAEAVDCFQQALRLAPDLAEAHNNLGNALKGQAQPEEAAACYRRALQCQPDFAEAHYNLGIVLNDCGRPDEAVACYQEALRLQPNYFEAHNNLGAAYKDQGLLEDAGASYRRAFELKPDYSQAYSNILLASLYRTGATPDETLAAYSEFNRRFGISLTPRDPSYPNDRDPDRRLRVGYVSPDFREHVVGRNILPLFREHDHRKYEVFCYAQVRRRDEYTDRFQSHADVWRSIVNLTDEALAQQVRYDRIDILVDLSMHTAGNRLLTMARKPAPVQVTFAGLLGTTGLSAIDYRLTDPYLDPPGLFDHYYSEKSFCLPATYWCYDPLFREPAVSPLPAVERGYVTFGCLNNFCKVNESVMQLWARVLQPVEGSRLLFLAPEGVARQRALRLLERAGIAAERVSFVSPQPHRQYLELYHQFDMGLDTFPYNGHATSLDSYWMGVPVITLVSSTVIGRAGLSQLTNLGLTELIGQTPDQFVKIAVELAQDMPRLSDLRSKLRARMERSPLMDAKAFTRGIEAAYRTMWKSWCAR